MCNIFVQATFSLRNVLKRDVLSRDIMDGRRFVARRFGTYYKSDVLSGDVLPWYHNVTQ
jgi:hypothetical protein